MKKIVFMLAFVMSMVAMNAQTRTAVKVNDLPKAITENLSSQHQGWTASEAFKIETKGVMTYEVLAKKGSSETMLVYDKDGKYLKMEPAKIAANTPSKSSTASTAKKEPAKPKK
jgi:hypothetical protein